MNPLRRFPRYRAYNDADSGVVIVLYAIALTAILGLAAMAIDLGNLSQNHQQFTNAADSAAESGAGELDSIAFTSGTLSESAIVSYVKQQITSQYPSVTSGLDPWTTCTESLPSADWTWPPDSSGQSQNCIAFNASGTTANIIQVAIPPSFIKYYFGKAIGVSGQSIDAVATAEVPPGGGTAPCGLCAISTKGSNLQNGKITLDGNSVYVDGPLDCKPQGSISVSGANGGIDVAANGSACTNGTFNPAPNWSAPTIPDPLGSLPSAPDYSGLKAEPDCNGGAAVPGIYNNIGTCTLTPGLYVVTGTFGGSSTVITGSGVTIFFTCGTASAPRSCAAPGEAGGQIEAGGTGSLALSACSASPCPGGATAGMAIWYDRNDTSSLTFHGNGNLSIAGTVYARSGDLHLKGTPAGVSGGCGISTNFCSEVVVNSFVFDGQGNIGLHYDASQNVFVPSKPPELCSMGASTNNC